MYIYCGRLCDAPSLYFASLRSLFWITEIILSVVGVLLEEGHQVSALFGIVSDSLPWVAHIQWLVSIQYEGLVVSEGLSSPTAPCGAGWGCWGALGFAVQLSFSAIYSFFHRCWFQELSHTNLHLQVCYLGDGRGEIRPLNTQESMSCWHCKLRVNSSSYYYTEMYPDYLIDVNVNEDRVSWFY